MRGNNETKYKKLEIVRLRVSVADEPSSDGTQTQIFMMAYRSRWCILENT